MKSKQISLLKSVQLLRIYYAATLLFIVLDYFLHINVRLAFLEAWPEMRALYYLLCFACLGLMLWKPGWSLWIGTIESMLSLSLLIVVMGVRVMTVSEQVMTTGTGWVTKSEIMNFMIVSFIAWFSYSSGVAALKGQAGIRW